MRDEQHMSDWRDIPGYGGWYQVSRMGEIRSWRIRGRHGKAKDPSLLVPYMMKRGKRSKSRWVKLTDANGKSRDVNVMSIVVKAWMGGCPSGKVPYHKNGDLNDNCVNNISFADRSALGKKTGANSRRMPVAKVDNTGSVVEIYPSARAAARANFMSYQAVLDRCNGKVKRPFALDGHNYVFDR